MLNHTHWYWECLLATPVGFVSAARYALEGQRSYRRIRVRSVEEGSSNDSDIFRSHGPRRGEIGSPGLEIGEACSGSNGRTVRGTVLLFSGVAICSRC